MSHKIKMSRLSSVKRTYETRLHIDGRTITIATYFSPSKEYEIAAVTNITENIYCNVSGTAYIGTNPCVMETKKPGDSICICREITQSLMAIDSEPLFLGRYNLGTEFKNTKMLHKQMVRSAKKYLKKVGDKPISMFGDLDFIPSDNEIKEKNVTTN